MARAGTGDNVEGTHAVAAALRSGRVRTLYVDRRRLESPTIKPVVSAARARDVEIEIVEDVTPFATTTAPQGVVAIAAPLALRTIEQLVGMQSPAGLLVVDHVENPRNLGAIARSAVAAGVTGIVLAERRAAPLNAAALKAAAGAFEDLAVCIVGSIANAVQALRSLDVWTVGLDAAGERSLFGFDLLAGPVAIVLGAEGKGLGRLVRDRVDVMVHIPMNSGMESLNVSAAAALAVFELARVRRQIT